MGRDACSHADLPRKKVLECEATDIVTGPTPANCVMELMSATGPKETELVKEKNLFDDKLHEFPSTELPGQNPPVKGSEIFQNWLLWFALTRIRMHTTSIV